MGSDAVSDLRTWQRDQASKQDKALRSARRRLQAITDLEVKVAEARAAFGRTVDELEATGLSREQCAAFLGLTSRDLARLGATKRRPASGDETAASPGTSASA